MLNLVFFERLPINLNTEEKKKNSGDQNFLFCQNTVFFLVDSHTFQCII